MNKKLRKTYGKFIIEFFDDGKNEDGDKVMGVVDFHYIDPKTPKEMQSAIKTAIKALHENYPYCIIAESDEVKALEQKEKGKLQ